MGGEIVDRPADQPAVAAPDAVTRRSEIEQVMRTDFDAYERSGLGREYHDIIESEMETADPNSVDPTRPMASEQSRDLMRSTPAGQLLVRHWESMGGFKTNLGKAQNSARALVTVIGDRKAQRAFLENFNRRVPDMARMAIYAEMAMGAPSFVHPLEQADVDHFASDPVGRELVEEWGQWAGENVSIILTRMDRIWGTLLEDDARALADWFDALSDKTAKHVVAALAN